MWSFYYYFFDNLIIVLIQTYSFRLMLQPDSLLSQLFTMHHIRQISHRVAFTDLGSNYIYVRVQRRDNKLYFTEGWLDLITNLIECG
ncbi:hypothetical protein AHAS_Ahas02G0097600 [Arachis hypogaea]